MYILQCPHDIHVHLFCFDLHKFLLRSRAVTCPTLNCGRGTSLFRQELVYTKRKYTNSWTHFVDFLLWLNPLLYSTLFYNFLHAAHVHNSNLLFVLIAYNIFVIYLLNYLFNIKTGLIYLLKPYTQHRTLWYSRAYDRLIWSPSYSGLRFRIRFPLQLSIRTYMYITYKNIHHTSKSMECLSCYQKVRHDIENTWYSLPVNHRPFTVFSVLAKLFEILILPENVPLCNKKFGFRAQNGVSQGLTSLNPFLLITALINMFTCSLQAEKCFDSIWNDGRFYELRNICNTVLWRFLYNWYSNLVAVINRSSGTAKYTVSIVIWLHMVPDRVVS